ncbi:hypothetical protein ACFL1E_07910 [Candidatus Omnitrophota bacterium]
MMRTNSKGYSLVMWTATIATAIAILAMYQGPLKEGLRFKSTGVTNYVFFGAWEDEAGDPLNPSDFFPQEGDVEMSRSGIRNRSKQHLVRHENHAGEIKYFLDPAENYSATGSITRSAQDGYRSLLSDDITDYNLALPDPP